MRPDLLHTHLVHGDIYGSIASRVTRRAVRLVAPQRRPLPARAVPVRRPAASRAARDGSSRSPTPCASSSSGPGLPREKLVTIHYGLDDAPGRAVRVAPRRARDRRRRAARARDRAPDRAEGPPDAAAAPSPASTTRASRRGARDPRDRPARGRDTRRSSRSSGSTDAVLLPGPARDPRLARARRRLRPHLALGGLRDRPARGDARRASRSSRRA